MVFKSFHQCLEATLAEPNLKSARGANIIRDKNGDEDQFRYVLLGQPETNKDYFVSILRDMVAEWAAWPKSAEAENLCNQYCQEHAITTNFLVVIPLYTF